MFYILNVHRPPKHFSSHCFPLDVFLNSLFLNKMTIPSFSEHSNDTIRNSDKSSSVRNPLVPFFGEGEGGDLKGYHC